MDVRYALRLLRRTRGFTAIAITTLALGIGATVAIASAAYTVLYRPLPLSGAGELVVPVSTNPARGFERASVPYADYLDWREQRDVFHAAAVFSRVQADLSGDGTPERIDGLQISEDYFDVIRAELLYGRVLTAADHAAGAPAVAVISERLWTRRLGADPAVVGRDIRLGGVSTQIIGVIVSAKAWPQEQDFWTPLPRAFVDNVDVRTRRDNMIFESIARLAPGASLDQARARMTTIADRVAKEHPESRQGWSSNAIPLREYVVEPELRLGMFVLLGGAVLVLLIACVNLANLLLARGADRGREVAVRTALGASRARLVRQLLTESLVLAAAGGAAGLALAYWLLQGLKKFAPTDLTALENLSLDWITIAIAVVLSVGAAVLFGVFPAFAVSALEPVETLREGGRGGGSGRRTGRMRDALVVAQMALAIVLLVGAGLMLRSVWALVHVDPGVDVDRVLAGQIVMPRGRYPIDRRIQFFERLTAGLASTPGIESAAATSWVPVGGGGYGLGRVFLLDGQPEPPASTDHPALWNVVTPDYFRTLGIPLVRGRAFAWSDTRTTMQVAIINQTMARRVFGDADPIGRRIRSWRDENVYREIVGVVADVRYNGLADEDQSLFYVPYAQDWWGLMTLTIRTPGNPATFADALRREVGRLDPDIAVAEITPLRQLADESIAPQRFGAMLLAVFAGAALILAAVGVYGVMSYAVTQRRHEFGVRLALGATPAGLFGLIVRRGLVLAAIGSAAGIAGSIALAPVMRELLSEIEPLDAVTFTLVPLVLLAVAFASCALPGRHAARTPPLEALRD